MIKSKLKASHLICLINNIRLHLIIIHFDHFDHKLCQFCLYFLNTLKFKIIEKTECLFFNSLNLNLSLFFKF